MSILLFRTFATVRLLYQLRIQNGPENGNNLHFPANTLDYKIENMKSP